MAIYYSRQWSVKCNGSALCVICKWKLCVDTGRTWHKLCLFYVRNSSRHSLNLNAVFTKQSTYLFSNRKCVASSPMSPLLFSSIYTWLKMSPCVCVRGGGGVKLSCTKPGSSLLLKHNWYHSAANRPNNSNITIILVSSSYSEHHKGFNNR